MPASAAYLTKYLTASQPSKSADDYEDSSRPKKRRKKNKSSAANNGLVIADDDADLSLRSKRNAKDGDDEDTPLIYSDSKSRSAEFRKKKDSAWTTVPTETQPQTIGTAGTSTNEDEEAERIIAAAAADSHRRRQDEDAEDAPTVVETAQDDTGQRMESGVKAGLQTAADTAMLLAQQELEEEREQNRQRKKKKEKKGDQGDAAEETIYRDATGRRIDVSMRRAEARAAELEKLREEKKERENAMGDVQRQQKEQAKQELEDAKFLTLGRTADDVEMNERLKEVVRWDDPMAQYMAEKQAAEDMKRGVQRSQARDEGGRAKATRKKEYQGHAPPNRYGIKPGPRWDGVDRGNGFEKEWFQARGRKTRNENLEYQWQMDE